MTIPAAAYTATGQLKVAVEITDFKRFVFEAYPSSAQTFSASTWTKVTLDTEAYDVDGVFDATTNSRYQPTADGYYLIGGRLVFPALASWKYPELAIYKNGSLYALVGYTNGLANQNNTVAGCCLMNLNGSTDYAEMWAIHHDTGNENNSAAQTDTAMWGFRVS